MNKASLHVASKALEQHLEQEQESAECGVLTPHGCLSSVRKSPFSCLKAVIIGKSKINLKRKERTLTLPKR